LEELLGRRPVERPDKARDFRIVVKRDELVEIGDRERAKEEALSLEQHKPPECNARQHPASPKPSGSQGQVIWRRFLFSRVDHGIGVRVMSPTQAS